MSKEKREAKREERRKKYEEYLLHSIFLNARQCEERDRIIKEREERRKALEAEITAKIKANLSDIHFKACPWCGEEPTIRVKMWSRDSKRYRMELKTCTHLNKSGVCLGDFDYPYIPQDLTCPNPDRSYDVGWNGGVQKDGKIESDVPFEEFPLTYISCEQRTAEEKKVAEYGLYEGKSGKRYPNISSWAYAVNAYFEYLSDDYPHQCSVCHKKWRGYESIGDEVIVDGQSRCHKCAGIWKDPSAKRPFPRYDVIHDSLNIDSMWVQDNPYKYYTSLETCLKCHNLSVDDCYTLWVEDKHTGHGWDALQGCVNGSHWEIWKRNTDANLSERSHWNFVGFVFEPSLEDLEILKKIKRRK